LSHVVAITTGAEDTCAVIDDGSARCWGDDTFGGLGDGTTGSNSATPVRVSGLSHVTSISAGGGQACAVVSGGTAWCWGYGAFGALGDGTSTDASKPMRVSGLSHVTMVSAGASDTCAVLVSGTARCWGDDGSGALGNGKTTGSLTPVPVSGLTHVTGLSTGNGPACALASGSVFCWGSRVYGDLGDGSPASSTLQLTPDAVVGLVGVTALSTGSQGFHTLARIPGKGIRAWGSNNFGQLGDGTTADSPIPVTVE
jgi:alpha-tubulin suppressor-like RCC1 family protein